MMNLKNMDLKNIGIPPKPPVPPMPTPTVVKLVIIGVAMLFMAHRDMEQTKDNDVLLETVRTQSAIIEGMDMECGGPVINMNMPIGKTRV